MQATDPTHYTDVSAEDFDRIKTTFRARGMAITGNKDDVEFDKIPVHIEYKAESKTLEVRAAVPHWLAEGVTLGALHKIIAQAMSYEGVPNNNENPNFTAQQTRIKNTDGDMAHKASATHSTHAPHAAKHIGTNKR